MFPWFHAWYCYKISCLSFNTFLNLKLVFREGQFCLEFHATKIDSVLFRQNLFYCDHDSWRSCWIFTGFFIWFRHPCRNGWMLKLAIICPCVWWFFVSCVKRLCFNIARCFLKDQAPCDAWNLPSRYLDQKWKIQIILIHKLNIPVGRIYL